MSAAQRQAMGIRLGDRHNRGDHASLHYNNKLAVEILLWVKPSPCYPPEHHMHCSAGTWVMPHPHPHVLFAAVWLLPDARLVHLNPQAHSCNMHSCGVQLNGTKDACIKAWQPLTKLIALHIHSSRSLLAATFQAQVPDSPSLACIWQSRCFCYFVSLSTDSDAHLTECNLG